jgi:hypothetical protein
MASLIATRSAPVLVVCAGRSGSTLLRAVLSRHPDLHVSVESHFWLEAPGEAAFAASPTAALQDYFASAPFRWLQLDPQLVLALLPARCTRREAFSAVMQADAQRHGKQRFGDKTPAHAFVLPALLQAYPHARVVHVVRDPRDVVASLARMPWASSSLLLNALYTRASVHGVLSCRADPRVLSLRLEDLLADPDVSLRRLLRHLQLPATDEIVRAMLRPAEAAPKPKPAPVPWLAEGFGPLRPASGEAAARPTSQLPAWAEALVELLCARHMEAFGYAPRPRAAAALCRPAAVARCALELARAAVAALGACLVVALALADRATGVPAERRAERQLRRWLNLNPDAWRHWPGWDAERAVAVQLRPEVCSPVASAPPVVGSG